MWEEGCVLEKSSDFGDKNAEYGYKPVDGNDLWNVIDLKGEYISGHIIENPGNAEWFERVYPVNLITKTVYKLKAEAKEFLNKEHSK